MNFLVVTFREIEILREPELREIIGSNPEIIEEGLRVLRTEFPTDSGPIDLLCVDGEKRLTVVELKLKEDDIALMQALRYYDWVFSNRDRIREMLHGEDIDSRKEPKIVLIAKSFSDTLRSSAKYVKPRVDLFEYKYLESTKTGEKGPWLNPIPVEEPEVPPEPLPTVKEHIEYITNENVRETCKRIVKKIKEMSEGISIKPTKYYLSVFFRGKRMAVIEPKRSYFYVYLTKESEWTDQTRIEKEEQFIEIFDKIKSFFIELGGQPLVKTVEESEIQKKS